MIIDGPVAILGLGLVGGSLARDLAAAGTEVWGADANASHVRRARRAGVITRVIDEGLLALRDARTLVLAVPVDAAPALLERACPHLQNAALITDVGSTKRRIGESAAALGLAARFVGSHPMAGDHRSGWFASRQGLFASARVYLCRTAETRPDARRRARALWRAVGARPTETDAARHDADVAFSSHLPQLLSLALAGALASRAIARRTLGTGGRDMTRLAASSPELWTAILDENATPVLDALDTYLTKLGALRGAVESHDRRAVAEAFAAVCGWTKR